jgi:hypothetical protein
MNVQTAAYGERRGVLSLGQTPSRVFGGWNSASLAPCGWSPTLEALLNDPQQQSQDDTG